LTYVANLVRPSSISGTWLFSGATSACCCYPLCPAMVARKGAGCRRCPAALEEIGECKRSHGSSTFPRHQVVRPRWLGDGQRQWFFAGKELSSILLLILSGDDWRTRAISGGDTQGLDCFLIFCSRAFVRIWKAIFSNSWFLGARLEGSFCKNVHATILDNECIGVLPDPSY
jgi:hypothetical protein